MEKRKLMVLVVALAVVAALTLTASAQESISKKKLVYWDYGNLFGVKYALDRCNQDVSKASGGRIKIKYEAGSIYGSGFDVSKVVGTGTVDMGSLGVAYHLQKFPLSSICEIVGIATRPESAALAFWDIYNQFPEVRAEWKKANLKLIGLTVTPPCVVFSKKPVNNYDDLKGLQVRAVGWSARGLKALGATVVSMSWGDVYPALERGTLDAASNCHVEGGYGAGFHEVTKYTTDLGFGPFFTYAAVMNLDSWNSLSKKAREIVLASYGDTYNSRIHEGWSSLQPEAAKAFKKYGLKVSKLPPDEVAKAQQILRAGLLAKWIKNQEAAGHSKEFAVKVRDAYLSLVDKYEKTVPTRYVDFYTKYATK